MNKYRFKYYFENGDPVFDDSLNVEKQRVFTEAHQMVTQLKWATKVDVYEGSKLIATFYK